ncbi:mannose/glucose-specific lectin-like [Abrus precatorius]|uniref:Mannose/glucose-specific lectin-like n=1 Tax=Abrus precatorius TaxID=3816 RepID=A0A8B8M4A0_ABRPR|nr:mannose/glucose-specific lectin-like [Abrus precatorius]
MAFSNKKSKLLQSLLIKILIPFLLLQYHSVKSQQSPLSAYETVGFSYSLFEKDNPDIILLEDASVSDGVIRLTKTDPAGKPIPRSVGRAVHLTAIHLWSKDNGDLADFTTYFSFVVNNNSALHGDGFAFFLAPAGLELPKAEPGGYLGLFTPETALDPTKNHVVAVEFDSFTNDWDPNAPSQFPHIGIDIDSVKSVVTAEWPSEVEPGNAVAQASINYNSESKRLSVFLVYPRDNRNATVSTIIDLRTVLPEWVIVGFSAATGDLVETHDILKWSFEAAL